ncbi:heptosyltransferase-3 [Hydrogenispora ethanolica]|uniref:Heptosyltransferase-3 n=1 Tax=Hydrogenispora ethanolica TaxID=1082276 RepID=A0A4R1S7B4_HYDET|nr:heptosyltransferase-3 [Hydrogenispora ethanolica]
MRKLPTQYNKIVIFCLSPLGDTLFATPAIRALKENLPRARIVVIASPSASEVLQHNPYQISVLRCADQWQLLKAMNMIRRENYDLAISFTHFGSYFTKYCAASCRGDFFSIAGQTEQPVIQLCLDILRELGLKTGSDRTEFWFEDADRLKVDRFLESIGCLGARPLVAVHCGGHYFIRKRWPAEKFVELLLELRLSGVEVALIGGTEDVANSLAIQALVPGVINAAGALRLSQTAALMERCELFIGNDSGPLHLAAAVGVPTIGLYGPTDPAQFYPYHPTRHRYIYKALPCSPCYRFGGGLWQFVPKCSRPYCMEAISVAEVIDEMTGLLCQNRQSLLAKGQR